MVENVFILIKSIVHMYIAKSKVAKSVSVWLEGVTGFIKHGLMVVTSMK